MNLPELVVGSSLPHSPVDIPNTFVVIVSETCERVFWLLLDRRPGQSAEHQLSFEPYSIEGLELCSCTCNFASERAPWRDSSSLAWRGGLDLQCSENMMVRTHARGART